MTISNIDEQVIATGATAEPTVTVTFGENTVSSEDYTIGYSNNGNAGTGTVTLTSKNKNFTEGSTATADFTILRALGISFDDNNRKWATYYAAEDLAIPTDMNAYAVTGVSGNVVTIDALDYIPSNVGVLLSYESDGSDFNAGAWTGSTDTYTSLLTGSVAGGQTVPADSYILYNNEFVRPTGSSTLAANRCYLTVSGSARQRLTIGDDATGIRMPSALDDLMTDGDWYSVDGRKFTRIPTKKGVYVKNGKKVVIK